MSEPERWMTINIVVTALGFSQATLPGRIGSSSIRTLQAHIDDKVIEMTRMMMMIVYFQFISYYLD